MAEAMKGKDDGKNEHEAPGAETPSRSRFTSMKVLAASLVTSLAMAGVASCGSSAGISSIPTIPDQTDACAEEADGGCSQDDAGPEADSGPDAAPTKDAGPDSDAGPMMDAGPEADAGPTDAGPDSDAGPMMDAGPEADAGPTDAGPDSGPVDSGVDAAVDSGSDGGLVCTGITKASDPGGNFPLNAPVDVGGVDFKFTGQVSGGITMDIICHATSAVLYPSETLLHAGTKFYTISGHTVEATSNFDSPASANVSASTN